MIRKAQDTEIWKAVIELVKKSTAPQNKTALWGGETLVTNSGSIPDSEATKKRLQQHIIDEFDKCTYKNVAGFFEKYFQGEDKAWVQHSNEIYAKVKKTHVRSRWKTFPKSPNEDAVWTWWQKFQSGYLDKVRCKKGLQHPDGSAGVYYHTKVKSEFESKDSGRQLDFFVKHRSVPALVEGEKHDWRDVRVVGEHRASNADRAEKTRQLARYMRNVFSAQPTRRFVHGFLLLGTVMQLWVFDRSGAYSCADFDIHKEPEKFVRVITGYALMSDEELGLDNFIKRTPSSNIEMVEQNSQKKVSFYLGDTLASHNAIVSRATCCYSAVIKDRTSKSIKETKHVIKFSWASDKRRPESEYIRIARERGAKGVPRVACTQAITSIADMRKGLDFSETFQMGTPSSEIENRRRQSSAASSFTDFLSLNINGKRSSDSGNDRLLKRPKSLSRRSCLSQEVDPSEILDCSQGKAEKEKFRNRILMCLATCPEGRPLHKFTSVNELLLAFRDAIIAHQSVYLKGKVLHRDISENNITITDPKDADGLHGIPIDYDLAIEVDENGENEYSDNKVMTGTLQFIAIQVLESHLGTSITGIQRTYRHDLESFFHVFLSICTHPVYGWEPGQGPKQHPLRDWYTLPVRSIAGQKRANMTPEGFDIYVLPYFSPKFQMLKGLAKRLRALLFGEKDLYIGTPIIETSSEKSLYDKMVEAFDDEVKLHEW